jgi:hypothetical protein
MRREHAGSIGRLAPEVLASEALWDRARSLGGAEREGYRREWQSLRRENAALRLTGPTGLRSAPISECDAELMSFGSEDWQRIARVIGSQMAFGKMGYDQVGDTFLYSRLAALIRSGELEIRGPTKGHGVWIYDLKVLPLDAEVRRARGLA